VQTPFPMLLRCAAAAAPVPEFKVFAGQLRSPFKFDGARFNGDRFDGAKLDRARLPDAMRPDAV